MYRAVELPCADRDLHRFLWRADPKEPLKDCRMTRVTFGVSSSAFANSPHYLRLSYTKTLGIAWHSVLDHFRLSVTDQPFLKDLTKHSLVSNIAKTYDVLGWFAPSIIKVKILLQRVWESKVDWDDPVKKSGCYGVLSCNLSARYISLVIFQNKLK